LQTVHATLRAVIGLTGLASDPMLLHQSTMTHGSMVQVIDPQGRLRVVHGWNDDAGDIAHDLQALLS